MKNQSIIYDAAARQWLNFHRVQQVIEADEISKVIPALNLAEEAVSKHGLYAAGFISYEASPAFDPAIRVRPSSSFPLLWFGLYSSPDVIDLPRTPSIPPCSPFHWTPSVNKAAYDESITRIKESIARGETYQVNYTFRLSSPFRDDAWPFFLHLANAQQSEYPAYIDTGRFAVCCASPELLFRLDGYRLLSRPMKGTAQRGLTLSEDNTWAEWLHDSEKNRAENTMIVDMVRNDLGHIAVTGSVEVPRLFDIERYPTIWQMTSTVTADSDASLSQIMRALFPGASITGAPKIQTTRIIASLETTPRNIYTGCIGFFAPGRKAQFNIAIRTALIDREINRAEYGVGSGIVWDSTSEEEFEECRIKTRILLDRRPEFSLLETLLWTPDDSYFLLDYHLRRVRDSAEFFRFPLTIGGVLKKLEETEETLPHHPNKVRMLVSQDGAIFCESEPLIINNCSRQVRLRLALTAVDSSNPFLYHKTTNREVYDSARAASDDCDDILLWNERGEITETIVGNIVVQLDGGLVTPPVSCGLLPGTYRAWLIDRKTVKERVITVEDMKKSEAVYVVNSVRKKREAMLEL